VKRVRGKIMKTAIFALLVSMIASTFAIVPAHSQGTTVTATPEIISTAKTPGSPFSVNITIQDVTGMLGYSFRLSYDTNVLTATGFTTYTPFTYVWPSSIDDAAGTVDIARTWPLPEYSGSDVFPGTHH